MIRVLVAEDSETTRQLLVEILRGDPEIQVVGEARNGLEAVEMTRRLRPDVVTMDVKMPVMDGLEATREIMTTAPTPVVVVSTSMRVPDVEAALNATRAGALVALPPPEGPHAPDFEERAGLFAATIKAMSEVKVVRRWPERRPRSCRLDRMPSREGADVVAIAASTGGPAALQQILAALPGEFPVPIMIVQHISSGFAPGLAAWLDAVTALNVKVAEDGEAALPGTVYVAPDDLHLGICRPGRIILSADPPVGGFRPSASFLFESVARSFGPAALALVLTGMGCDGVAGLQKIRDAGGWIVAQDEASSVVYGMPGAAARAGLVNLSVRLSEIPCALQRGTRHA